MERFDIVIIGAGIAGASVAWHMAPHARIVLLEAEAHPGYHSTGRSAAFYAETYGGPAVQPLTTGSKAFFMAPPEGFASVPLVRPRGALHVAPPGREAAIASMVADFQPLSPAVQPLTCEAVLAMAPVLRPERVVGGVWDPDCQDIDVAALHQGFLAGARRQGALLRCAARVTGLHRQDGLWQVATTAGDVSADIVVNAAGAWADEVAQLAGVAPLGLSPRRRTVLVCKPDGPPIDPAMPLLLDIDETWYAKPDAGALWVSPADETPMPPCDVQPDELDLAITIDRLQAATYWTVPRIERSWSGLRSFTPSRTPHYGFASEAPGFFWCAGQGGFGIQTAPAAGALCRDLLLGVMSS
jgi:D-arginine dehydrogenase